MVMLLHILPINAYGYYSFGWTDDGREEVVSDFR